MAKSSRSALLMLLVHGRFDIGRTGKETQECGEEEEIDPELIVEQECKNSDVEGEGHKFSQLVCRIDDSPLIDDIASYDHQGLFDGDQDEQRIGDDTGDGIGDDDRQKHELVGQGVHDGAKGRDQLIFPCQIPVKKI